MEIKSSAFKEGMSIPSKYTCDNLDISTGMVKSACWHKKLCTYW